MPNSFKHSQITDRIINSFYKVYNTLGYGFLEKVYENAMYVELQKCKLDVERQQKVNVFYERSIVGEYFADLLVEGKIIVELKACEMLAKEHEYQLVNYLRATEMEIGLLLNFGKKPEVKRKIFSNKKYRTEKKIEHG